MAASWVMPVAEEPPRVAVAVDKEAFTYELIESYGEFTVNVCGSEKLDLLYTLGTSSGRSVDKVKALGLSVRKGVKVDAPVLADAIGVLECTVSGKLESEDTTLLVGDVVYVEVSEELFD